MIFLSCLLLFIIAYSIDHFVTDNKRFRRLLINLFTFIEFISLSLFIWINLTTKLSRTILAVLSFLFIGFLIYFNFTSHFKRIDSIPIGIESIIIISFSFYFLYERTKSLSTRFIYNDYRFWIIIGMIIYLAGSFFIYLYGEQLDPSAWKKFRYITLIFFIIRTIFFAIGILIFVKTPEEKPKLINKNIPFLDIK